MNRREKIIANYIEGYNTFDINKMVADLDECIEFENMSNGKINMSLTGLASFIKQAEQAKDYFSSRVQTVKSYNQYNDQTEVEIDYNAILAIDLPNGIVGFPFSVRVV